MRLTIQTDYAVRTLMYLAAISGRATIDAVAGLFGISSNHVGKAVNQLARLGYVRSIRGVGGGIELAREPHLIRLGDLIVALEGPLHLLDCVDQQNVCAIESFCKLRGVLAAAENAQLAVLNESTLADVVPRRQQLQRLQS